MIDTLNNASHLTIIGILLIAINTLWGIVLILVIAFIRKAIGNIEELNKSSHSLSVKLGQVDTKVDIAAENMRVVRERIHGLVEAVGVLKGQVNHSGD